MIIPGKEEKNSIFALRYFWFERRGRGLLFQLLVLFGVASFFGFVTANTIANLEKAGLTAGFSFLNNQAFFDINQRLISFSSQSSFGRALVVGLLNTLLVSSLGIATATLLGFLAGICRLSNNWLLSRAIGVYVEVTRNVPLLLQIIFWWATLTALPRFKDSITFFEVFHLNNRGLRCPAPIFESSFLWICLLIISGILLTILLKNWQRRLKARSGRSFPVSLTGFLFIIILPTLLFFALDRPISWELPQVTRFNFQGGFNISPELLALWIALSTYTGAFISEIVRSGILSVSPGQVEAARSLGLSKNQTMRLIIMPQAFRVIIPPLTSQYLNLTKNSSLAIAIGYQDLVSIGGTILNQSGHALEIVAIWMVVYLSISIGTSLFMNWYNKKISLVER